MRKKFYQLFYSVPSNPDVGRRSSLLARRLGDGSAQLSSANIDTLFIGTSCNSEFNVARLEHYLAMASQAEITPALVLTKADTASAQTSMPHDIPLSVRSSTKS